jgi:iron complex outermembrane receptor protein
MIDHSPRPSARTLLLSLISTLPLALPGLGKAQQAPSQPALSQAQQERGSGSQVSELVVTAEKRENRLVDVPTSISVQTASDLEEEHIVAISDLAQEIPNVLMSGSSLFPDVTIRGVGSSSGGNPGFAPAATMYVDEVYQGRERAENLPVCGISQVEVLRGPQGTLYGKDTIAGAINITTEAPTDTYHASADVQQGNLDFTQICATASGPIVADKLDAGISYLYRHRDGDILNEYNGDRLDFDNASGIRGRAIWKPTSRLTVDLEGDYLHEHDTESELTTDYSVLSLLGPPYSTAPTFNPDTRTEALNSPEFGARDVWGASMRINYDFNGMKLTSITAGRGYATYYAYDSDGTALNEDAQTTLDDDRQFSQELRLTSTGGGRFQWIVGAYYYRESLHDVFTTNFYDQFPTALLGLPALPTNYDDVTVADANVLENSYAGFASGTWKITDKLVLEGGVRWTLDDKTLHFSQLTTEPGSPFSIGELLLAQIPPRVDTLSESVPTGDVSLTYEFSRDQAGYIKFSRGYKAGGFNAFAITNPFNANLSLAFKPEFLNNYEVGFKGEWFDNRLSFNGDVFYDDYTNKQKIVEDAALFSFTVLNAAAARIYGSELEGDARPFPGFDLSAKLGLLDAHYTSFPNGGEGQNFTGNKVANAPEFTGTFAAQYHHEIANGWSGMGRIEVFHSSSYFEDPNNTPAYETLPYTYLNARLGVQADNGRWGVYLWGSNLTNRIVFSGGYAAIPVTARAVNFPRLFGVEFSARM